MSAQLTIIASSTRKFDTTNPEAACFLLTSMRRNSVVSLAAARNSLQVARSGFFALPDKAQAIASRALVGRFNRLREHLHNETDVL